MVDNNQLSQAHIVRISQSSNESVQLPALPHLSLIIHAGVHAQVTYHPSQSTRLVVHIEPHAQLTFVQSDEQAVNDCHTHTVFYQQQNSLLTLCGRYSNSGNHHMEFFLTRSKAELHVCCIVHATGDTRIQLTTVQHHEAPDTHSQLRCKGLLENSARVTHHGMISIAPHAQQSQADLQSKFLLLSSRAQAYAQPNLEILTNDVRCSHGTSIGSCDDEQLFYMMTRGIPLTNCLDLLKEAFLQDQ